MIPFLDLARDFSEVETDARRRIDGVLASARYVLGPETGELERTLGERLGAQAVIAVSSGSDALALVFDALGIGRGDAVVVPSFTFFATAGAVVRVGATPVFADVDPATLVCGENEWQAAVDREFRSEGGVLRHRASGARLAALVPVHLYGRACPMDGTVEFARASGARVVEDAAQAIDCRIGGGAGGGRGKSVGRFGDAGCFSFYPTKNLGGAGDGGLVTTDDAELAARIRSLRNHGSQAGSDEHAAIGINARMAELVAAVLNAKLARLDAWTLRRRQLAALYSSSLRQLEARGQLVLPAACPDEEHVWHQYAVRIPENRGQAPISGNRCLSPISRRDRVRARLEAAGVATRVFYPLPLHRQPCFASFVGDASAFPHADAAAREILCLPIHPSLDDAAVHEVVRAMTDAVESE